MDISTFYGGTKQSLFSSVIRSRTVYLAIVGEPFISLIYGVASRIVDIFVLKSAAHAVALLCVGSCLDFATKKGFKLHSKYEFWTWMICVSQLIIQVTSHTHFLSRY